MMRHLGWAFLVLATLVSPAAAQSPTPSVMDSLLGRLVGRWQMTGTVRGCPATYHPDAQRVLAQQFVELHMIDVAQPPAYEALGEEVPSACRVASFEIVHEGVPERRVSIGEGKADNIPPGFTDRVWDRITCAKPIQPMDDVAMAGTIDTKKDTGRLLPATKRSVRWMDPNSRG